VLVVIDTLRRDHLSLYGYSKRTSPGLEELAKESVVFENCLTTSPWTKPSVASLMTGLYPSGHRVSGKRKAPRDLVFLAETLSAEGYATAGFSGNPYMSAHYDMDQGFARFHFDGGMRAKNYSDLSELLAAARGWLNETLQQPNPQPFFLYIHAMNVHGPYTSPDSYRTRFLEGPVEDFPFQGSDWKAAKKKGRENKHPSKGQLNDLRARYDGAIAYTDDQLSAFFNELKERGIFDESILVITSDHGEELYDHRGLGHGTSLHTELLDVPLLLRLPGGHDPGLRIRAAVSLVDVPATLLDAAGLLRARPGGRFGDGTSLLTKLSPLADAMQRPLLAELGGSTGRRAALVQRWPHRMTRVEHRSDGIPNTFQLYNLESDPGEKNNLSKRYPALLNELDVLLGRLQEDMPARVPDGQIVTPDPALHERLEALGYIE